MQLVTTVRYLVCEVKKLKEGGGGTCPCGDLQEQIDTLKQEMTQAQNDISDLKQTTSDLSNELSQLQDDLTQAQDDITQIQEDMMQVKDDIVNLQDSVNNIEDDISNINDEITTIQDELAAITESQFVGTWSANKAYTTGQTVAYITNVYKALQDSIGQEPAISPAYWEETGPFEINGGEF